jgi:hypothetical protein
MKMWVGINVGTLCELGFQKTFSRFFGLRFILDLVTRKFKFSKTLFNTKKVSHTKNILLGEVKVKVKNKIICRGKEVNVEVLEIIFHRSELMN